MDFTSYLIIGIGIGLSAWVIIKQKSWWELTPDEKKRRLPLVITGLVIIVLGVVIFYFVK